MTYSSMPYVVTTLEKWWAHEEHANDTHETSALDSMSHIPLSSASMSNRTVNFAGKHC